MYIFVLIIYGTRILTVIRILFIPFMCIFEEEDYLLNIILDFIII